MCNIKCDKCIHSGVCHIWLHEERTSDFYEKCVAFRAEGDYEAGWIDGYNHALDQTFKELNSLVKNHVVEELRKQIKR